jgi:hypothetical protein
MDSDDTRDIETLEQWSLPLEPSSSANSVYLIKVPEWASELLLSAPEHSVVGSSDDGEPKKSFRFNITSAFSFTAMTSSATFPSSLSVIETRESSAVVRDCAGVFAAVPVRDAAYLALTRSRIDKAEQQRQRKTVLDSRPLTEPSTHIVQMFKYHKDEGSHKAKQLKATKAGTKLSVEELSMSIVVAEDVGWNVQGFARKLKETGAWGVGLKEVKRVLCEICDLVRRGDDTHAKYYLKREFKPSIAKIQ